MDADASLIVASVPECTHISSAKAWAEASKYLKEDLPFHAHEVFEQRWRSCPPQERDCWRALAQWGAALTHLARGNAKGSREVARRAQELFNDCKVITPVDSDFVNDSLAQLTSK
jgi:uncharacterized protein